MDANETIFNYAVQSISTASSLFNALLVLALVVLYTVFVGSRRLLTERSRLQEKSLDQSGLLKELGDALKPWQTYYEKPMDMTKVNDSSYSTSIAMLRYAMFQLDTCLNDSDTARRLLDESSYAFQRINEARNILFKIKTESRRGARHRLRLGTRFNELSMRDIQEIAMHDVERVFSLYNQVNAIKAALVSTDDVAFKSIYDRTMPGYENNLRLLQRPPGRIPQSVDSLMCRLNAYGFDSLKELEASVVGMTARKDAIDKSLDEAIEFPFLGINVAWHTLAWIYPLTIIIGGGLILEYLLHARATIDNISGGTGKYQEIFSHHPMHVLAGEHFLQNLIRFVVVLFPSIVAGLTLGMEWRRRETRLWRVGLVLTLLGAALFLRIFTL